MAIYDGSRYVGAGITNAPDSMGVNQTAVDRVMPTDPAILEHVRVSVFARLDSMANNLFNDPTQWWRIADANPQIIYPDEFPIGTVLAVPHAVTSR